MNCLYCQQEMKNLSNPHSNGVWQCLQCPHEVRFQERNNSLARISIFVKKDDKEYCLHWYTNAFPVDQPDNRFDISVVSDVGQTIFKSDIVPENLTPSNAYQKLLTYLTFL